MQKTDFPSLALAITLGVIGALLLAGCGGGDVDDGATPSQPATAYFTPQTQIDPSCKPDQVCNLTASTPVTPAPPPADGAAPAEAPTEPCSAEHPMTPTHACIPVPPAAN